ncbi:MAG: 4Fe-4S binding protein [Bacteroidales bacterium]|jgi:NAD-dependent dihydropyrimidine dehydrogenase PreA subunit|nr:4Fe-4S binding protein [Bacteroidales bacterium]
MAYVIDPDKCVACGNCMGECPVGAILEGDTYSINADECVECGACADACPAEAIHQE